MPTVTQGYVGVLRGVSANSYGQTIVITLKDLDGAVQDVSSFDQINYAIAMSPDKRKTVSATLSLVGGGSGGVVSFSWADGDIDRPGDWELQLVMNASGSRVKSFICKMPVIPGLAEDV